MDRRRQKPGQAEMGIAKECAIEDMGTFQNASFWAELDALLLEVLVELTDTSHLMQAMDWNGGMIKRIAVH